MGGFPHYGVVKVRPRGCGLRASHSGLVQWGSWYAGAGAWGCALPAPPPGRPCGAGRAASPRSRRRARPPVLPPRPDPALPPCLRPLPPHRRTM